MATLIPAIRAQMGTRTYFIGKMRARDICQQVGIAAELENWDHLTIEELYQRDLNRRRVETEIAPYLVNTGDRFFGSIIVLVNDPESIEFETVGEFGAKLPASYQLASTDLGFLTVGAGSHSAASGGLVALDGQHRLAALRLTVQGAAVRGPHMDEVAMDEVTAVFVLNSSEAESRRLFTTLNRSARKVSRSDLLLMSEDDGRSVVARRLLATDLLSPRGLEHHPLVKWTSNTISPNDTAMTTLNALSDVVDVVGSYLRLQFIAKKEYSIRPPEAELDRLEQEVLHWTELIFTNFAVLNDLRDRPEDMKEAREDSSPYSMVLKPAGFVTLFRAIASGLDPARGARARVADVIHELSELDWSFGAAHWRGVLVQASGRISGRRTDWNLAGDLMALAASGESAKQEFIDDVTRRYRVQIGDAAADLPDTRKK